MSEDKKTIVKMAHIYTQEGRWDKAINEYKKLLKLDPEDFNTYSVLGDAHVKKGEVQPAFDAYLVCSDAYVRLGQLEKAALAQSKIARLDPATLSEASKAKQAVFQKQVEGDKAMDSDELDKAIEAYLEVLKLDRDRFDLYQKLGDLYLRKGETEAAVAKYMEIANIYFANKLYKKAAPIYLKVVELDPEAIDAHAALADIQAKSGNESEAKRELITLTEFLFQRGDYDRAYDFALRAEALKAIESYNYLGHVLLRRGKTDEAKTWFDKLLKFKLNHAGALWGMGLWNMEKGLFEEAHKLLVKVPATERFYAETQVSLAQVLEKLGKNSEAAATYHNAALAFKKKGLAALAKEADEKFEALGGAAPVEAPVVAVESAPAPVAAEMSVAEVVMVAEVAPAAPLPMIRVAEAEPVAEIAPAFESSAPNAEEEIATLVTLAESQEDEGDFDGALDLYQRIVEQFPADKRGKEGSARVYAKVGKGGIPGALAMPTGLPPLPPLPSSPSAEDLAKLAGLKAAAEAEQLQAELDAKKEAEDRIKAEAAAKLEAELRAKAEMDAIRIANEQRSSEAAAKAVAEAEARMRAETETRIRAEIEARQKAEAEAKRHAEDATRQIDQMRKQMETEIRAQLEAQMRKEIEDQMRKAAEVDLSKKMEDERGKAEAEAKRQAEEEIRKQFEEERKKLENQKADEKRRMEGELRQRLTLEIQQQKDQEAEEKLKVIRAREEEQSRTRIQSEVLARVTAQQKEKMAPLQRTIEEIRRKVEEQAAANAVASGAPTKADAPAIAPVVAAKPEAAPKTSPVKADDDDDMDPFMNAAVADIYVKQGLIKEAVRIYEKILKLDPNNTEIKIKLDVAMGRPVSALPPSAQESSPAASTTNPTAKKSKVSYL